MLGLKLNGSQRIARALARFEEIASELESAAEENRSRVTANYEQIAKLSAENMELSGTALQGERVAAKLRDLTS